MILHLIELVRRFSKKPGNTARTRNNEANRGVRGSSRPTEWKMILLCILLVVPLHVGDAASAKPAAPPAWEETLPLGAAPSVAACEVPAVAAGSRASPSSRRPKMPRTPDGLGVPNVDRLAERTSSDGEPEIRGLPSVKLRDSRSPPGLPIRNWERPKWILTNTPGSGLASSP